MRIKFGDQVDLCVRAEYQDLHLFLWLHSDEMYIVLCDSVENAQACLSALLIHGYLDIGSMYCMDKNWRRI